MNLSQTEATVLKTIQQFQQSGDSEITLSKIGNSIGMKKGYVSRLMSGIRDIYPNEPTRIIQDGRIDNHKIFWINVSLTVSNSLTAYIIVELRRYSKNLQSINRSSFIKNMLTNKVFRESNHNALWLENKLNWALGSNVRYLTISPESPEEILTTDRADIELTYLKQISKRV